VSRPAAMLDSEPLSAERNYPEFMKAFSLFHYLSALHSVVIRIHLIWKLVTFGTKCSSELRVPRHHGSV
jgi:hypothetical protein